MNTLLQALELDGLVVRPETVAVGRVLPAELADKGRRQLAEANAAVAGVESRMLSASLPRRGRS